MRIVFVPLSVVIIVVSAVFLRPTLWFFIALPLGLAVVGFTLGGRHASSDIGGFDKPEFG